MCLTTDCITANDVLPMAQNSTATRSSHTLRIL
uniref:Uncharacterized protein n=1 Tax=Arundo donax TaxID=35708 RepID=A0A0A9HLF9_ARUDO